MIDLLIAARKDAGLSQMQVGERLGQRQTFVSKYELGERRLDAAEFVVIARAIGANPYSIMERSEKAE
ncbi:helix-turn-helix domain-containing protein [Shinella zoogloeoides]|uniref:helix-turn-helix domain-containing protein n=1 Tax=Shinella zoogloeoides TaxID=352475 RepID=UPI000E65BC12|nr:helix-turn-helix transcriptional regulator [Shinella zoogloeoides]